MKVYISGAITGTTDYMERFDAAERKLIDLGHEVVNPAFINSFLPKDTTWDQYMAVSMALLDLCDGIYMIDGWKKSKGACKEHMRAFLTGKQFIE